MLSSKIKQIKRNNRKKKYLEERQKLLKSYGNFESITVEQATRFQAQKRELMKKWQITE